MDSGLVRGARERLEELLAQELPAIVYAEAIGPNGRVRDCFTAGGELQRLLGYTPQEWSLVWEERIHPEDKEKVLAAFERFWRGESGEVEFRYLAKDGRAVWVRERARAVRRGEEVLVYGVLTDITSEVLAHQALEAVLAAPQEEIIYVADPGSYEILYLNPAGNKLFGDPSGRKCHEAFQGRDSPCPFCTNELILREPGKAHVWLHRNERNGRYYRCTDRAIPWPDGQLVRFELAVDVTELVRAQEELQRQAEQLRATLEALPHAAFLINRERRIIAGNRAAREWAQVGQYCWEGIHKLQTISPEMRRAYEETGVPLPGTKCWFCLADEALESGRPQHCEVELYGRHWDTWWAPIGEGIYLHYAADVTEYRQAERQARALAGALEESERRFRKMLDEVRLVAVMLDREGRITYANPYLLELTGWSWEEVEGKDWFGLFLPEDVRARVRAEAFNGAIESERLPGQYENEILTRDGRRRLIRWSNAFLRAPGGEIVGTASIGEDVTEARRQERLREAIYAISRAAARAQSLEELGQAIQEALGGLMPVRNFYLAVHDGASGEVHFPWYADEKVERQGLRRRGGGGVTERILRTGRPLLAGAADLQRLYEEGEIASLEPLPQYYLGVPVPGEGGRPVGVLAVQSYDPAVVLGPEELEVLEFAAREVVG